MRSFKVAYQIDDGDAEKGCHGNAGHEPPQPPPVLDQSHQPLHRELGMALEGGGGGGKRQKRN